MAAASMGRLDLVRLLIVDHGADVNIILTVTRERERVPWQVIETLESWTALAFAVSRCRADCVEFLLARGAEASGLCRTRASGRSSSTRGSGTGDDPR